MPQAGGPHRAPRSAAAKEGGPLFFLVLSGVPWRLLSSGSSMPTGFPQPLELPDGVPQRNAGLARHALLVHHAAQALQLQADRQAGGQAGGCRSGWPSRPKILHGCTPPDMAAFWAGVWCQLRKQVAPRPTQQPAPSMRERLAAPQPETMPRSWRKAPQRASLRRPARTCSACAISSSRGATSCRASTASPSFDFHLRLSRTTCAAALRGGTGR